MFFIKDFAVGAPSSVSCGQYSSVLFFYRILTSKRHLPRSRDLTSSEAFVEWFRVFPVTSLRGLVLRSYLLHDVILQQICVLSSSRHFYTLTKRIKECKEIWKFGKGKAPFLP